LKGFGCMSENTIDLSIIIVHFNTEELTEACLSSLVHAKQKSDKWEIILVDNGSTDGSGAVLNRYIQDDSELKKIASFIKSETNIGFSAGNNLGMKQAKGKCILLLNSDTEVPPDAIQTVLGQLQHQVTVGAATCKLVLPGGSIDPACHRGFPTPWAALTYFFGLERLFPHSRLFAQYHMGYKKMNEKHEIDAISGAFFMVKRKVIDDVGLLDESYFMYGEDIDWAYRIHQHGYKILFLPQVSIIHKKKQSGRENLNSAVKLQTTISFYQTMQLFYRKHYQEQYPFLLSWIIVKLLDIKIMFIKKGFL
jgi:GT2 family glycosyltransferase